MSGSTKERPILFSGPMVRAILDGRKTVTRRTVKMPRLLVVDGITPEGIRCSRPTEGPSHREGFAQLWEDINGTRAAWSSNPWVWRVEFRRVA